MPFRFLKYLQPTHYFRLKRIDGHTVFPKEEALRYAAERGLCYFEVSAKDATNFPAFRQKLFQRRRLAIRERERQNADEGRARSASVNLKRSERSGRTKNNCC